MNKNLGFIAAGLATMALATGALADQTALQTKSTEALGTLGSKTDWTKTLSFDKFDTTLGTLDSVCLTIDLGITSSGMLTNNATGPETFKTQVSVDVSAAAPGYANDLIATASTPNITLAAGDSTSYGPIGGSQPSGPIIITTGLGAYSGAGTFDVTGSTLTGITILGGGGNVTSTQTTYAILSASVFYKYTVPSTDVPEPGAVAMLVAGGLTAQASWFADAASKPSGCT